MTSSINTGVTHNMPDLLDKTLREIDAQLLNNIREARKVNTYPAGIVFNGILSLADTRLEGTGASPDDVVQLAQLIWEATKP